MGLRNMHLKRICGLEMFPTNITVMAESQVGLNMASDVLFCLCCLPTLQTLKHASRGMDKLISIIFKLD